MNDQIIRDVCWPKRPLKECLLVLLQVPSLDVAIEANGAENRLTIHETASLMEYVRGNQAMGFIRIRTLGGPFARTFTIYLGRQPRFQTGRLDAALVGVMARLNLQRGENLFAFRDKWRKEGLNDLESRYLDGVVEYCHGWQLEREGSGTLARERLEESMELLMPFHTELAVELRCALALRMNCFAGQWGCEEDSPFALAERFFCRGTRTWADQTKEMRKTLIPLDPNSGLVLDALRAYYAEDDRVFEVLGLLRTGHRLRDRNDEDKLNLIEARANARSGNRTVAANLFELFRGHPLFGEEAEAQLNALS